MAERQPDWTEREFEKLLQSHALTDEELAAQLQRRSPDAVNIVRQGIHAYHAGKNTPTLSEMMIERLHKGGNLTCPLCGAEMR